MITFIIAFVLQLVCCKNNRIIVKATKVKSVLKVKVINKKYYNRVKVEVKVENEKVREGRNRGKEWEGIEGRNGRNRQKE